MRLNDERSCVTESDSVLSESFCSLSFVALLRTALFDAIESDGYSCHSVLSASATLSIAATFVSVLSMFKVLSSSIDLMSSAELSLMID